MSRSGFLSKQTGERVVSGRSQTLMVEGRTSNAGAVLSSEEIGVDSGGHLRRRRRVDWHIGKQRGVTPHRRTTVNAEGTRQGWWKGARRR